MNNEQEEVDKFIDDLVFNNNNILCHLPSSPLCPRDPVPYTIYVKKYRRNKFVYYAICYKIGDKIDDGKKVKISNKTEMICYIKQYIEHVSLKEKKIKQALHMPFQIPENNNKSIQIEPNPKKLKIDNSELMELKILTKEKEKEKNKQLKNLLDNFQNLHIVYLFSIDEHTAKFGYTNNIKRRLGEHKRNINSGITLEYCIISNNNREIEKAIKMRFKRTGRLFSKIFNGKNQTELIRLDNEFTIHELYKVVTVIKSSENLPEVIKDLNSKNVVLKQNSHEKDLENVQLRGELEAHKNILRDLFSASHLANAFTPLTHAIQIEIKKIAEIVFFYQE